MLYYNLTGIHGTADLKNVQSIAFYRLDDDSFDVRVQGRIPSTFQGDIIKEGSPAVTPAQKLTVWNTISAPVLALINSWFA